MLGRMSLTRKSLDIFIPKSNSRLEDTINWKCIAHAKGCTHHSWRWTHFSRTDDDKWIYHSVTLEKFFVSMRLVQSGHNRSRDLWSLWSRSGRTGRSWKTSGPVSPSSPFILPCLTSSRVPELEGERERGGRRRRVWREGGGRGGKVTFCDGFFLTFMKSNLELQTSSFDFEFRSSKWEVGHLSRRPLSPLISAHPSEFDVFFFFLFFKWSFFGEDNIESRTSNLDFDFRSKFEVLQDPGRSTGRRFLSVSSMGAVMMEDRVSLPRQTWTPPGKHLFPVVTDLGDSRSICFSQHQNWSWKQSSFMITRRQRYFKFVEVPTYVEFTSWADEIVLGSCKQEKNIFVIFLSSSESLRELTRWKKHDSAAHLGTGIFKCYVCDTICVHTQLFHKTGAYLMNARTCWFASYVSLISSFHKHFVIVSSVCVCLIICLIMINSHISFTLRHVLSVLLCDVSPYPLICMTHCSSCVMCRFPYCLRTPYPEALDRFDVYSPLPNVCTTRKLTVWITVRPRSLLQNMQSVHISALSSVVLCTFFRFVSMFYWPICQSQESHRKPQTSTTTERRTWLSHKRIKRRCSIKPCTLWRSAHLLHETSRPWVYAQGHLSHLLTNARLQERFKRRNTKLAQLIFSRSITNLLHCSVRVSVHTRDLGHFKLLKVRKGTFTILSQTLSKKLSLRENTDNTSTGICSSIRCKFQSCLESQDNPKRLSKPFTDSLQTNILTTSTSTSSPPFAINSVLTVFLAPQSDRQTSLKFAPEK